MVVISNRNVGRPKKIFGKGPKVYRFSKEDSIPDVSFGTCINYINCKNNNVDLAEGLCVRCWDIGINHMLFFREKICVAKRGANAKRKRT